MGMDSTNLIVNSGSFSRAVSNIGLCSACLAPPTHRNDLNSRRGLVSDLRICCTNTECNKEKVSDPYVIKSKWCVVCARQTLDPESEEYAKYWDRRKKQESYQYLISERAKRASSVVVFNQDFRYVRIYIYICGRTSTYMCMLGGA